MDQKATEDAGYDKGLKAGLRQGLEQGLEQVEVKVKQKQYEIAKKMKEENLNLETIIRLTGLAKEEIENL